MRHLFALLLVLAGFSAERLGSASPYQAQFVPGPERLRALGKLPADAPAPDLAASLFQAANSPQTPFRGTRRTTWTVTQPGTYVFPAGTVIAIPPNQARTKNAVDIKSSFVTIRGLKITSGFRGFSCQQRTNITLEDCTVTGCGVKPSGGSHGGSNLLFVNCKRVTWKNVNSTEPLGEHCAYISATADVYTITGCTFGRQRAPSAQYQGVFQVNSEGGSQATNISLTDCKLYAKAPEDVVALMGAGTQAQPVLFQGGSITGGRRFLASNYAAGRASYAVLRNVPAAGVNFVTEGGSWVHKS